MAEPCAYRHGLEQLLDTLPRSEKGGLVVTVKSGFACFNLRGEAGQAGFAEAILQATNQELPLKPNTFSSGQHRIFWQGPNEWLIESPQERAEPLQSGLMEVLSGMHASVTDISGGMISMTLRGDPVGDLLAKGCTLDLDPNQFIAGACAQTGLAKANVLIARISEPERFEIFVRRSFADYLLQWLNHAGREFRIGFQPQ